MDVGDITDPNLDGDFQALLEERKKRKNYKENLAVLRHLALEKDDHVDVSSNVKPNSDIPDTRNISNTNGVNPRAEKLLAQLVDAVERDDEEDLSKLCSNVAAMNLTLDHPYLRAKTNNATILHAALETERWKAAKYLITFVDVKILSQYYNITIRNLPSKKYCLHILTEKGNYELTKLYIEQFSNESKRNEILKQTVTMELEGQRPRPLASIHIAAMKGHTELVQLFYDLGVDVNTTNNKNDTPVLWAARGNHVATVRRLITLGADLELENDKGSTPLHWAVRYGFPELVKVLVTEGKVSVHQQRKLGLVSPIILASALGYHEIVDILLDNGADANTVIANTEQTALHYASAEGNNDVIRLLLIKGRANVNHIDSNGNTALLFAAKAANISTMKVLIENGAQFDCGNKTGQNIWDIVMRSTDTDMLKALAKLYKLSKHANEGNEKQLVFPVGRTPLHIAACNGDVNQIRSLFELGAERDARDFNGNTYYHVAALNDRSEILKVFLDDVDIESVNADGNTALHLAAKNGHLHSVQILLSKFKLEARNKLGMTPLHMAAESDTVNPDVIRSIVEVVVKASNWSLVDARENRGSTALHIAAHHGRLDIFQQLGPLNPTLRNDEGNTPFHLAARSDESHTLETMLEVFYRPEKGVNIDQRNDTGESTLHECVRRLDAAGVELLVMNGADLALKNIRGNAALHILVEEGVRSPSRDEEILLLYRTISRCATKWWCMKYNLQYPTEGSEMFYQLLRTAMLQLTSYIYNEDGFNVIDLATKLCAFSLLDEILNTANVYRFKEIGEYVYDVTNLTPQTTARNKPKLKINLGSVGVDPEPYSSESTEKVKPFSLNHISYQRFPGHGRDFDKSATKERQNVSCLDLVVSMTDEVMAAKILDINPFKSLVKDYWNAYQWIYGLLMLIHIIYMILFSVYVMPAYGELTVRYNSSTISQCRQTPETSVYGLFLIWPILILIFEVYQMSTEIVQFVKAKCFNNSQKSKRETDLDARESGERFSPLGLPYLFLSTLFSYISHFTAIAFCCTVIAWFVLFLCATTEFAYVEVVSLAFILGWMFTISFTKGFEELHVFTIMLKYIVLKDITRFLIIYVFVLVGCGLAFNALFQISSALVSEYPTAWLTIFSTFNLMLGLGGLFDGNFDETYAAAGGNPVFIKCIYIFYIIIANIILLSLLIAMMTDTYTDIKSREGTTWRVGSLRLALRLERSMPCLKKILRATHLVRDRISYDANARRWIMSMSMKEAGNTTSQLKVDQVRESVHRLEKKLENVNGQCSELIRHMDLITLRLNVIIEAGSRNSPSSHVNMENAVMQIMSTRRPARTVQNWSRAVTAIRERPFVAKNQK